MQADGKIAEGTVGERKGALHAAGIQKAQRPVGIIAAQVEVLVEVLVIRLDGFCAEELVELAARPEREFGGVRFAELAGHPLTIVDYALGGLYIVYLYVPGALRTQELYKMIPYVVTIVVLILVSVRDKKENQGPASLGLSYFREDR